MNKKNVIDNIVKADLCSGCGICVSSCPSDSLIMKVGSNGDLRANWFNENCKNCGLCLKVCPFENGLFDPRELNELLYGPCERGVSLKFHEDTGFYDISFVGYSQQNRPTSASGGLLTWAMEELLESGEVDRVSIVDFEKDETYGYSFKFKEARSVEEIRKGSGSIYHQVEFSGMLNKLIANSQHKWAVTGVPCLCAAIRKAMLIKPELKYSIKYVFGLACGMYQNRFYTEYLLEKSGVNRNEVTNIQYRRKKNNGSPSNFRFSGSDIRGHGKEIPYKGVPYYLGKNAYFRLNSCNYCMDVFAEAADACFMDAWLPEFENDPLGTSLVLVRNPFVRRMFEENKANGTISIDEIPVEKVVASQKGHVRRKRRLIKMRLPEKFKESKTNDFSFSDRFAWLVQRYVQKRSKEIWAEKGRPYGVRVFERQTWILKILIESEKIYSRISNRILRTFARVTNLSNR